MFLFVLLCLPFAHFFTVGQGCEIAELGKEDDESLRICVADFARDFRHGHIGIGKKAAGKGVFLFKIYD